MFKYSETEHCCYNMRLHYKNLPSDLVDITDDEHNKYWLSNPPEGKTLAVGYPFKFVDIQPDTKELLAQIKQCEMIKELEWCDLQVKLHASSDRRAVATIDDIYAYARDCRDYIQSIDGVLTVVGDKPVRPS